MFAGIAPILAILPGRRDFLGTMYSFGATLSFTVAHASIVRPCAPAPRSEEPLFRARPNIRFGGVDWPLFAILGGLATGLALLVVLMQKPATRWAGLGWLALGFAVYIALPPAGRARADRGDGARARPPMARRSRSSTGGCSSPSFRARPPTTRSTSPPGSRPSAARRSSP